MDRDYRKGGSLEDRKHAKLHIDDDSHADAETGYIPSLSLTELFPDLRSHQLEYSNYVFSEFLLTPLGRTCRLEASERFSLRYFSRQLLCVLLGIIICSRQSCLAIFVTELRGGEVYLLRQLNWRLDWRQRSHELRVLRWDFNDDLFGSWTSIFAANCQHKCMRTLMTA